MALGSSAILDTMSLIVWAALLIALVLCFRTWRRYHEILSIKRRYGCEDAPKYPHKDKIWGSDLAFIRANMMREGRYFHFYADQFEKYGKTFEENFKGRRLINTVDPLNLQHAMTTAYDDYCRDPMRLNAQEPFLGPSVFSNEPIHRRSRALINPVFRWAELSDLNHLAPFAERFLKYIPGDNSTIDVQPLLHKLFLDVSMEFIFGKSLDALSPQGSVKSEEFIKAFGDSMRGFTRRREAGWLRFFRYAFDTDWKKAYSIVHKFVDEQVEQTLKDTHGSEKELDPEILPQKRKRYILVNEMAKTIRDPIRLRYELLGVFLPAHNTTSIAVGNCLWQLARHPEHWQRLRQISMKLLESRPLTFDKLKSLVEFRHVILETIRLVGPAARIWKIASRDTVLPTGGGLDLSSPVFVPKGTILAMGSFAVQLNRDLWGEDVAEFKPERWIGLDPRFKFVPWGGGPRKCPAQQQVITHATYMLVRLTQAFESIENRDPIVEYVELVTMGFESKSGVQVAFKSA